ncbi:MAG TPA: ABC transporter permease [Virgibacillus sp.]|nr:ABC transporter permease [Virgibacillus sp.]
MMKHVYFKEMKDSFRDRKTIFLSVIIPILFNIGLVFFMDQFLLSEDSSDQVNVSINESADAEVMNWLENLEQIHLIMSHDPLDDVKEGDALVAVEADANFTELVTNEQSPLITIYSEPTSSKGGAAVDTIMAMLTLKKNELITDRLSEANVSPAVMEPFEFAVQSTTGEEDVFSKYMISIIAQIIIVIAVLMGGLPASSDLFAGEKERKTMEALIMTPVKRIDILVGKWLTIASLGIMSGIFSVLTLVIAVQLFTVNMKEALNLSDNITFFIGSLSVGIVMFALLVAALQMILSLLADNMKEAQNYVTPITMVAMIPYFILIGVTPHELTTMHFVIPFMNIYALIKQLIYGVYDVTSILLVVGSSAVFIGIIFAIGMFMFSKSKWVLGKS